MKLHKFLNPLMIFILLVSVISLTPAAGKSAQALDSILYVDVNATGSNDGTSWENAFTNLQPAMDAAIAGDQVWVAAGTYLPMVEHCGSGNPRYQSFQLKNGVAVYGGFDPSVGDVGWDDRDWVANVTITSGDIGVPGDNSDNSYHVFCHPEGLNLDNSAILDGFTIQYGNANGDWPDNLGGGMYNSFSSPALTNIIFSENSSGWDGMGGGMYNNSSSPSLVQVTFYKNGASGVAGGMYNISSSPTLMDVTFSYNSSGYVAGGMYNDSSSPSLINVTFSYNTTGDNGGGMFNGNSSSPSLTNVIFAYNVANYGGGISSDSSSPLLTNVMFFLNTARLSGAGMYNYISSSTLTNATFSGNFAAVDGGGIYDSSSSSVLVNCILWGDIPNEILDDAGTLSITYSDIQGGHGGMGNIEADPLFVSAPSGSLRLQEHSPTIDAGNNTADGLIGLTTDLDGYPRFIDDPLVSDTGYGTPPIVDMGAYEYQNIEYRNIIFVDIEATGNNDGASWIDAYTDLQPAMEAARFGDQIWVAAGTYLPTIEFCGMGDERYRSFQLINGVVAYGGFDPSIGDDGWEERDWMENETILSGDIGVPGDNSDNSYHVFCHPTDLALNSSASLNGFIIKSGYGFGIDSYYFGGGMYNENSSPTLVNVIFLENLASTGGGMYNVSSAPRLINVIFSENAGDALGNDYSSPDLTNVIFINNVGRGMYNKDSYPKLTNCTFAGNTGGGISNINYSIPILTNCIMWGDNSFEINGAAVVTYSDIQGGYDGTGNINSDPLFLDPESGNLHLQGSSPAIDAGDNDAANLVGIITDMDGQSRFTDISTIPDTGNGTPPIIDMGAYEVQSSIYFVDVEASGNDDGTSWQDAYTDLQTALDAAVAGDQVWVAAGTYLPTTENCETGNDRYKSLQLKNGVTLYGGFDPSTGDTGWEQRNWMENTAILSGDIGIVGDNSDNSYHVFCHPDGLNLDSTAILDGFIIRDGNADGIGVDASGGGMYNSSSSPSLINLIFSDNSADEGGGLYNDFSSPGMTNALFVNNLAVYGGAIYNANSSPSLTNVTSSNNTATYGGSIYNVNSTPTLVNAILWGDTLDEVIDDNSFALITYSDIQGGYSGAGNIEVDPLFIDTANRNFRLQDVSPAIDAGDNSAPGLVGITIDLDGKARFVDVPWILDSGNGTPPIVDMGAYEYHLTIYVDVEASGNNDGTSWEDAYTGLQPALEQAVVGDQIWVAAGTYYPTVAHCGEGDRFKSFQLKNGVTIYGGFDPSAGDASLDRRDWVENVTILSGDPSGWGIEDNSYHVFCHPYGLNLDHSAVLDGFTITGGNGLDSSWPNYPRFDGAGMYNDFSSPSLVNIIFSGNVAKDGGGIYNRYSSPVFTNVSITGNSANGDIMGGGGCGGGMYNSFSSPVLTNVSIISNSGIFNFLFTGCGGGMANYDSNPTLTNVTIYGNTTDGSGGAMTNTNSFPTLTNCILWGNLPDQIAGDPALVTFSDVQGGYSGTGNLDIDPQFMNAVNGNLRLRSTSPAIDAGNNEAPGLIGITTDLDGNPRFVDIPTVVDTGVGTPPIVDMGAYEARNIVYTNIMYLPLAVK